MYQTGSGRLHISVLLRIVPLLIRFGAAEVQYCVIIDAGSTGSRLHAYQYVRSPDSTLPVVQQHGKVLKNYAALSSFAVQPQLAGASLEPLVQFAQGQVPEELHAETSIHLLATAGLRLLDRTVAEAVLESCRQVLATSGFKFESAWAAVLAGSTEGIYGWIAANLATLQQWSKRPSQQFGPDPEEFIGVLELGGASFQVTFQAEVGVGDLQPRLLALGDLDLTLVTHSFLGFGQDSAQQLALRLASSRLATVSTLPTQEDKSNDGPPREQRRVLDPCLPRGFEGELDGIAVSGGGYFGLCRQVAAGIVVGNCSSLHCGLGGTYLPPLTGKFLGIENLQYTAGFLGLPHSETSLRQVIEAGQVTCSMTWPDMQQQFLPQKFSPEHLLRYCFGAAYAVALLHDGLGFGLDDSSLVFTDTVVDPLGQPVPLDWTLGAVVVAAAAGTGRIDTLDRHFPLVGEQHKADNSDPPGTVAGKPASSTEILLIFLGILLAAAFCLQSGREQRRLWKRKRQKARSMARSGAWTNSGEGDADDESTDSESPLKITVAAGGQNVGRRQLVSRSADLEQGGSG